jgi:hypothetical protein
MPSLVSTTHLLGPSSLGFLAHCSCTLSSFIYFVKFLVILSCIQVLYIVLVLFLIFPCV